MGHSRTMCRLMSLADVDSARDADVTNAWTMCGKNSMQNSGDLRRTRENVMLTRRASIRRWNRSGWRNWGLSARAWMAMEEDEEPAAMPEDNNFEDRPSSRETEAPARDSSANSSLDSGRNERSFGTFAAADVAESGVGDIGWGSYSTCFSWTTSTCHCRRRESLIYSNDVTLSFVSLMTTSVGHVSFFRELLQAEACRNSSSPSSVEHRRSINV